MKSSGSTQPRTSGIHRLTNSPLYFTPAASSSSTSFGSSMRVAVKVLFPLTSVLNVPTIVCSPTVTSATRPARTACLKSLYEIGSPAVDRNHVCRSASSRRAPSTYQIGPPGRAAGPNARRSPGRRSRGFNPGGVLTFGTVSSTLPLHSRSYRRSFRELEPIVTRIDHDVVALPELTLQHTQCQGVEHLTLDRAFERPRAVSQVVALGDEVTFRGFGQLDMD